MAGFDSRKIRWVENFLGRALVSSLVICKVSGWAGNSHGACVRYGGIIDRIAYAI